MKKILLAEFLILILSGCINDVNITSQYKVDMRFDSSKLQMDCKMHVKWYNSSSKEVMEIPFHFQLDSAKTLIKHIIVNDQQVDIQFTSKETDDFEGFVAKLTEPIRENEYANIKIDFKTNRKEYYRDRILFFSEDIPLIQYFKEGNFIYYYQVHSNYNVKITYPADFEIATTGFVKDKASQNNLTTIQTEAKYVPSYGVVFFSDVIINEIKVTDNIIVRSIFFEDDEKWGNKLLYYAEDIIQFYKDTLGFYPQPVLHIIPGGENPRGGWPVCPNIVAIHRGIDSKGEEAESHAQWIMAHEIGHQYWGFNYILEPLNYPQWFGIAMGIYTDRLYCIERNIKMDYNKFLYKYLFGIYQGWNTTIMQKIDFLDKQNFDWNNTILHGKSFTVLRLLAFEIGEDNFYEVFKYFLNNYKGVNVTPEMFKKQCERISNRELDNFFQQWFYSNEFLEYQIDTVIVERQDSLYHAEIRINKTGKADISEVEIAFKLSNDEIINQVFDGKARQVVIRQELKNPIEEIVLDPEFKLPLVNKIEDLVKNIKP
jgi:hypothetical protein